MAKVARLIIYEADEKFLKWELLRSLREGEHVFGKINIKVLACPTETIPDDYIENKLKEVDSFNKC